MPVRHGPLQTGTRRQASPVRGVANVTEDKPWVKWGEATTHLPDLICNVIQESDLKPDLVWQTTNLICGQRVLVMKEDVSEEGKSSWKRVIVPEKEAFLKKLKKTHQIRARATNLESYGNAFTQIILVNGKAVNLKTVDCNYVLSGSRDTDSGEVEQFFVCDDWTKPVYNPANPSEGNVTVVPGYVEGMDLTGLDAVMVHSKYYQVGHPYYSEPRWYYGTKEWADLAKKIPELQNANLDNGMTPRFIVRIPESYFDPWRKIGDDEVAKTKRELEKKIIDMLAGRENTGKSIITYLKDNIPGHDPKKWEIEEIKYDTKDQMFLESYKVAGQATSRSHGLHPILSGLGEQGTLGSGSEILNLYNYHVAVKCNHERDVLLEILDRVDEINQWNDGTQYRILNAVLTTTDKNPTGTQNAA